MLSLQKAKTNNSKKDLYLIHYKVSKNLYAISAVHTYRHFEIKMSVDCLIERYDCKHFINLLYLYYVYIK